MISYFMRFLGTFFVFGLLLSSCSGPYSQGGAAKAKPDPAPVAVKTLPVTLTTLPEAISANGELFAEELTTVSAKVPGRVAKLYAENDFLLHGSGPSLVGEKQVAMWRKQGPKPYGVLGITQGKPTPETAEILSGAQFVYFRDSVSLETAKAGGVK